MEIQMRDVRTSLSLQVPFLHIMMLHLPAAFFIYIISNCYYCMQHMLHAPYILFHIFRGFYLFRARNTNEPHGHEPSLWNKLHIYILSICWYSILYYPAQGM